MLSEYPVCAVLAVKDLDEAKKFYGDTLGLKDSKEDQGGVIYKSGKGSAVYVYESQFAGTNKATAAAWNVEDVPGLVKELKGKGVKFDTFDLGDDVKWDDEVAIMGPMKAAWFSDPDGNILNIVSGM